MCERLMLYDKYVKMGMVLQNVYRIFQLKSFSFKCELENTTAKHSLEAGIRDIALSWKKGLRREREREKHRYIQLPRSPPSLSDYHPPPHLWVAGWGTVSPPSLSVSPT
ncbi:hypothetical protein TNCV_3256971 [Trichonephila clavipes]|nr:hypothetical protein TNCV_3256971 [Trichonephila clavipes]